MKLWLFLAVSFVFSAPGFAHDFSRFSASQTIPIPKGSDAIIVMHGNFYDPDPTRPVLGVIPMCYFNFASRPFDREIARGDQFDVGPISGSGFCQKNAADIFAQILSMYGQEGIIRMAIRASSAVFNTPSIYLNKAILLKWFTEEFGVDGKAALRVEDNVWRDTMMLRSLNTGETSRLTCISPEHFSNDDLLIDLEKAGILKPSIAF